MFSAVSPSAKRFAPNLSPAEILQTAHSEYCFAEGVNSSSPSEGSHKSYSLGLAHSAVFLPFIRAYLVSIKSLVLGEVVYTLVNKTSLPLQCSWTIKENYKEELIIRY